ncbi:MAG: VOC family protein [Archangium sp.]|nr:VOC family protein [Archangium sp.]MDP3154206.1 VOC family protein [Archangium sp.]MDP3569545.1 VOC family protein [Archangium sp.]
MSAQPKLGFFVKLLVLDREASAKFYEQLGFVRVGADATFIHLRWEDRGDVLLVSAPTGVRVDGKRGWGVLLSFTSSTELTAIAERAATLTAPTNGPEVKPWNTRELVVTDPDGYRLNFVQAA